MRKVILKEVGWYILLLCILASAMHPDLISMPLERLRLMGERENYIHPFVYTLFVYLFVAMFRMFFRAFFSIGRQLRDQFIK